VKAELKNFLKAKAHTLKPVVIIGHHGLTEAVLTEIEVSLEHHELIKIRVNALDRNDRKLMIDLIVQRTAAELVQTVGHIAVIYRKSKKK
jgi:RNA-binding protein